MGTDLTDQLDHMELIAGDGRIVQLTEIADLGNGTAQVVVLFHRRAQSLVGDIDAVDLMELVQHLLLQLGLVIVKAGLIALHGRVDDGDKEALVLHRLQQEEMLLHPLHGGAALRSEQGAQIVEAALDGPLQNTADIGTVAVGHVVGRHIRCGTVWGPQPGGKTARQIQQHLRNVVAVIAQRHLSLTGGLLHQSVVRLLQKVLKIDQMLEIFHDGTPSLSTAPPGGIFLCKFYQKRAGASMKKVQFAEKSTIWRKTVEFPGRFVVLPRATAAFSPPCKQEGLPPFNTNRR